MTYKERQGFPVFCLKKIVPARVSSKVLKTAFERRAKKFAVDPKTKILKYKRSDNISLRFFAGEEVEHRNQYIDYIHDKSEHSWQDLIYDLIRRETYVITKEQVVERISSCKH